MKKNLAFRFHAVTARGAYDPQYEEKGVDYPLPYVRWTQQRNFEAFLELLAHKALDLSSMITHRFAFKDCLRAYEKVSSKEGIGLVIQYPADNRNAETAYLDRSLSLRK